MTHILVFGDSITYGAWDIEGGWVQRLRKFLDQRSISSGEYDDLIYNMGVSADTTELLLKRLENETKNERLEGDGDTVLIFSIGVNDANFVRSKKAFMVTPQKFKTNLKKLTNIAKKLKSSEIVFVGLTPVDDPKLDPIPWATHLSVKNSDVEHYNDVIKSFCDENKIHFVDVFSQLISLNYRKLLEDGIHPNSAGHEKIFEIVKDYLIKNKIIRVS